MSDSILEQITQNLVSTLNGLRVVNGYSANIEFVRPLRKGREPEDNTAVVFITDIEEISETTVTNALQRWLVQYEIEIYLYYSESDTTPVDKYKANIFADIIKLLEIDAQRGAPSDLSSPHLALDTSVKGFENFFDADGAFEGMTVTVHVDFRSFRNNPYSTA